MLPLVPRRPPNPKQKAKEQEELENDEFDDIAYGRKLVHNDRPIL
jgi:hypothetical protein